MAGERAVSAAMLFQAGAWGVLPNAWDPEPSIRHFKILSFILPGEKDGTATTAAATTCTLLLPGGSYTKTPTYACPAGQQRSTACKNYLIPDGIPTNPTQARAEPAPRRWRAA